MHTRTSRAYDAGERALLHAVHETLDDSGDEAGVNSTTHDAVAHHELAAPRQGYLLSVAHVHLEFLVAETIGVGHGHALGIGLDDEMNLAKLACTARLLFVAIVGTGSLGDCLAIRYLGLLEDDGELVVVLDTPLEGAQVELALTREDGLLELLALLDNPCGILLVHAGEDGHEFLGVALGDGTDGTLIFGRGELDEVKLIFTTFLVESVACAHILKLHGCTDVTGHNAVNGSLGLATHAINLGEALLGVACHVFEIVTGLESAAHDLEIAHLADVGLDGGLEHKNAERAIGVGLDFISGEIDG